MDEELTESEWVRIKDRQGTLKRGSATDCLTRKTENMRPFTDREAASHTQTSLLMGNFKHPNICQHSST